VTPYTFTGGVHPPARKLTAGTPIEPVAPPGVAIVPLSQHIGAPAEPVVKKKDHVKKGQMIGRPAGFVSVPVHAPVAGVVRDVAVHAHPLGAPSLSVMIENDGSDEWAEGMNDERPTGDLTAGEIRDAIRDGGIVGMGGAAFPTHVKLAPPDDCPVDTLIVNGCECEPYLTADHQLMLAEPARIVGGTQLMMRVLGIKSAFIAIEDNKPDAVDSMRTACADADGLEVVTMATKYPQGAEKQLIKAFLGRDVPTGGLPMHVGVVVQNVGTAAAVFDAVACARPLVERVITVTGEGVEHPGNFLVTIGSPVEALLDLVGLTPRANKVVMGGPMMGIAQATLAVPVIKGTSGIVVLEGADEARWAACIHCGRCVEGCPMRLRPSLLSRLIEADLIDRANATNLADCIECGVCAYVCPSRRPIVHQIKFAKAQVAAAKRNAGKE